MSAWLLCIAPVVIDGDSLRCSRPPVGRDGGGQIYIGEIRLLAVDAPDYRRSRPCVGGYGDHVCDDRGALRARQSLRRGVRLGRVTVRGVTRDRYGRLVAQVRSGSTDLSCYQLERGVVRYIARYDNGRRIARACRSAARKSG